MKGLTHYTQSDILAMSEYERFVCISNIIDEWEDAPDELMEQLAIMGDCFDHDELVILQQIKHFYMPYDIKKKVERFL